MLYLLCPTCGNYLGAKQYIYEFEMEKLYKKYYNPSDSAALTQARQKIVNELCEVERYCCKTRMLTYLDFVYIVK